jgi:predicted  nucleic acid-binding Zn-ribbon protein
MAEKIDISIQLDNLVKLQGIDAQIYKLNDEKESRPQAMEQLKAGLTNKQAALKDAEARLKNFQVKRKEKEIELETKEAEIKKLQVQLYQLKTNKEYSAMLHEIESKKADKSLLEDEILKFMEDIESTEADIKKEKQKFEEESKRTDTEIKSIGARIKEIENMLAELQKNRAEIIPNVNPRILKDYERILNGRGGIALVQVVNDACGGCYMQLPPQVINEIRMKEQVIRCENCQRMLYIKDEAPS